MCAQCLWNSPHSGPTCVQGAVLEGAGPALLLSRGGRAAICTGLVSCSAAMQVRNGHSVSKQRGAGCPDVQQCVTPGVSSLLVAV